MTPRARKELDPKSKDFGVRFGIHLRELLDKRKLGAADLLELVQDEGLDVSPSTIKKWVAGERLPRVEDLQIIGLVLNLRDYRHSLPPPK